VGAVSGALSAKSAAPSACISSSVTARTQLQAPAGGEARRRAAVGVVVRVGQREAYRQRVGQLNARELGSGGIE
jgi:hypothetical protein